MTSIKYLTEVMPVGKDEMLTEARADKLVSAKRHPTLEACLAATVKVVERHAISGAASLVHDELAEALQDHVDIFGDRAAAKDPDDWDTQLDAAIEDILTPYSDVLSADWMAKSTIDSGMWQENGVDNLSKSFGKEVFKQLCWHHGDKDNPGRVKQPAQILANAGILQSDVMSAFGDRIGTAGAPPASEDDVHEANQEQADMATIESLIPKMRASIDVDEIDLDELEGLCDSDDILAQSSASRLGLDAEDIAPFQMYALNHGSDAAVAHVAELLRTYEEPEYETELELPGAPVAAPVPPAGVPAPPAPTPPTAAAQVTGKTQALVILKEHCGVDISTLAATAGVSRGTFNNMLKGTSEWKAEGDAVARVRETYVAEINALLQGLAVIDGTQPMAVS